MLKIKSLKKISVAAAAITCALSGVAHATTVNFGNATCVANCGAPVFTGTTGGGVDFVAGLQVGTVYEKEVGGLPAGVKASVEVIGLGANVGTGASSININGTSTENDWMHLRFSFLDAGNNPFTIAGNTTIRVTDVDSNAGRPNQNTQNFTEVVAINKPIDMALTGSMLEEGGFLAGGPAVDASFNFQRLKEVNGSWQTIGNATALPAQRGEFAAVYDGGSNLGSFDLIWGLTGARSNSNVRGFEVLLDVAPVPVPAALPLFASGIGAFALMRRRNAKRA